MSKLTVQEALEQAELIDQTLASFMATAPQTLGSADALAAVSQLTCIGPIPRLDQATWAAASLEYEARRHAQHS